MTGGFSGGGGGGGGSFPTGHVENASDHSGANGGAQIQAALDALPSTGGTVLVGPDGPDDGSSVTGVSRGDIWTLSSSLTIDDDQTLLLYNAYLALADDTDDNIIRNATAGGAGRDSNFAVIGIGNARLDGNAANQFAGGTGTGNVSRLGIRLDGVDQFTIAGVNVGPTHGWAIRPEDWTDGTIHDVTFSQDGTTNNQDGIHTIGPGTNLDIRNVQGVTGDDGVVPAVRDASGEIVDGAGGDVTGVLVDGVFLRTKTGSKACIRLLPDDTHTLEHVTVRNVYPDNSDTGWGDAVKTVGGASTDRFKYITLDTIEFDGASILNLRDDVRELTIKNCKQTTDSRFLETADGGDLNLVEGLVIENCVSIPSAAQNVGQIRLEGGTFNNVRIDNCKLDAGVNNTGSTSLLRIHSDATVNGLRSSGCRVIEGTSALNGGVVIEASATVSDVRFDGWTFEGVTTPYSLNVTDGVLVDGLGEESGTAATPTTATWQAGDMVDYTDTDTASNTGIYVLGRDGSTWIKLG